jgi:hypothetical protein
MLSLVVKNRRGVQIHNYGEIIIFFLCLC